MVVGLEGITAEPLPNGHGLPRNAGDIDAIRVGQQCRRSRIHMHPAVAVVISVHHDNVHAFVDECRYPQSVDELSTGGGYPWTRQRQQHGVGHPGA